MSLSGLVAYDSSDNESGNEQEKVEETKAIVIPRKTTKNNSDIFDDEVSDLPKPSEKERELADLAKKEKASLAKQAGLQKLSLKKNGKIIIGIPSLAELEDDEEEAKKPKKTSLPVQKGQSKLFTKLPPPKNSTYVPPPEDLSNTIPVATPSTAPFKRSVPLIPQSVMRRETRKDSDDEDETSGSFFTIEEPTLPAVSLPVNVSYTEGNSAIIDQAGEVMSYSAVPTNQLYNMAGLVDSNTPQPTNLELDDAALEALQGTSGVKRKLPEDAQIIDIKQERLTYDPNNSYVKAISEEQNASTGEEFTYNKLQKKKHQITWLAAQAKAREVELKNQWAANRNTRKQTQAKYGF